MLPFPRHGRFIRNFGYFIDRPHRTRFDPIAQTAALFVEKTGLRIKAVQKINIVAQGGNADFDLIADGLTGLFDSFDVLPLGFGQKLPPGRVQVFRVCVTRDGTAQRRRKIVAFLQHGIGDGVVFTPIQKQQRTVSPNRLEHQIFAEIDHHGDSAALIEQPPQLLRRRNGQIIVGDNKAEGAPFRKKAEALLNESVKQIKGTPARRVKILFQPFGILFRNGVCVQVRRIACNIIKIRAAEQIRPAAGQGIRGRYVKGQSVCGTVGQQGQQGQKNPGAPGLILADVDPVQVL